MGILGRLGGFLFKDLLVKDKNLRRAHLLVHIRNMGILGLLPALLIRDKTSDHLCAHLRTLGIDAEVAREQETQEVISASKCIDEHFDRILGGQYEANPLGLVHISNGPIRAFLLWESLEVVHAGGPGGGRKRSPMDYYTDLVVPSTEASQIFNGRTAAVPLRDPPIGGNVVNVIWRGEMSGGIVDRLNGDDTIKAAAIKVMGITDASITIYGYREHSCWVISLVNLDAPPREIFPSKDLWECFKTLAMHLLQSDQSAEAS